MVVLMLTVLLISLLNTLQHVILVITFLSQKPLGMNILLCVKNIEFPCSDVSFDVELISKIIFDLK